MSSKIKLYQGDCLEIMKNIPDNSVDMVLCDLPYGVTNNKDDISLPFDLLWENYNRICKNTTCIALFGQGLFYIDLVNSNRKDFRYDLVWDKVLSTGFLNANRMPLRQHEQIAIFYKELPTYNPQFYRGSFNHSKGNVAFEKEVTNNNYGDYAIQKTKMTNDKYPISILKFQKPHPSKSLHRTEKPVDLLEYLIKTYTNEGDIVLDNCMGSGTTGIACKKLNRNFIGIELDKNYFNIAKERIKNAIVNKKNYFKRK